MTVTSATKSKELPSFSRVADMPTDGVRIAAAEICYCQTLATANRVFKAVMDRYPELTLRTVHLAAVGAWAIILVKADMEDSDNGTQDSSNQAGR